MKIIKFKTNIESEEALTEVASYLDKEESISRWHVDTESKDKLLSVSGTDLDPHRIQNVVQQAGYKAEIIRVVGIGGKDL